METKVNTFRFYVPEDTKEVVILSIEGWKDDVVVRQENVCCISSDDTPEQKAEKLIYARDSLLITAKENGLKDAKAYMSASGPLVPFDKLLSKIK